MAWYEIGQLICIGFFMALAAMIISIWIGECVLEIRKTLLSEHIEKPDTEEDGRC